MTQIAYSGLFSAQFRVSRDLFNDLTAGKATVPTFLPRLLTAASRIQSCTYRRIITYQTPQSNLLSDCASFGLHVGEQSQILLWKSWTPYNQTAWSPASLGLMRDPRFKEQWNTYMRQRSTAFIAPYIFGGCFLVCFLAHTQRTGDTEVLHLFAPVRRVTDHIVTTRRWWVQCIPCNIHKV